MHLCCGSSLWWSESSSLFLVSLRSFSIFCSDSTWYFSKAFLIQPACVRTSDTTKTEEVPRMILIIITFDLFQLVFYWKNVDYWGLMIKEKLPWFESDVWVNKTLSCYKQSCVSPFDQQGRSDLTKLCHCLLVFMFHLQKNLEMMCDSKERQDVMRDIKHVT